MAQRRRRKRPQRPWESIASSALSKTVVVVVFSLISMTQAFSGAVHNVRSAEFRHTMMQRWATASTKDAIRDQDSSIDTSSSVGMYVHIPYCRRRCRYCDFAIVPIGPSAVTEASSETLPQAPQDRATRGFLEMDAAYRAAILKEISLISKGTSETSIPLRSIYFGGGTPSLAPIETLHAILGAVLEEDSPFVLDPNAEISIEMDPGTFSLTKLQALKEMGFNRISLGVQSFDDGVLESIGRCHRREDIMESISSLHRVYGENANYSIDLISGLPGVSLAKWAETLETATTLSPQPSHLSLYDLQVESGTVFGKWYNENREDEDDNGQSHALSRTRGSLPVNVSPLPGMEECAFSYKYASGYLKAKGYEHYEISSYAYRGNDSSVSSPNRSRHNQIYWEPGSQWFAVGLGATSSVKRKKYARPRTMVDYIKWVDEEGNAPIPAFLPDDDSLCEVDADMLTDIIMTRLRTSDGLDLDWIKEHVPNGKEVIQIIVKGAQLGLELGLAQHVSSERGSLGSLRLVDPGGFLFSNSIISSIFAELGIED